MNATTLEGARVERVIDETRHWVERAVIGLNLCPFAKAAQVHGLIRYGVSPATTQEALLADLTEELQRLAGSDPQQHETTLLVHPHVLQDFLDFNDFLDLADEAVRALDLEGVLQVASFHPAYRFEGTAADDIENWTNRSPYPTLHLLREDSIARAVEAMPDTDSIYRANIDTLRRLGHEGWARWMDRGAG